MNLGGLFDFVAPKAVGAVTLETALLPPVVLEPFSEGGGGAPAGDTSSGSSGPPLLVRLLRPRVTVQTVAGPVVVQPGPPPPELPYLLPAVVLVGVLAVIGAVAVVRTVAK